MASGSLVSFIALLSVNLGLINLFPIPILDGGHLVFYAAEAHARPAAAAPRAGDIGFRAGLALIACIFVFVTWNDLTSFGLFRWIAGLIGCLAGEFQRRHKAAAQSRCRRFSR